MGGDSAAPAKPKLLVCELWGIGDLVLASTLLRAAATRFELHLVAKPHARELLAPSYPEIVFHDWIAPWTVHRGKYRLWQWPWFTMLRLLAGLRREGFTAAVSVRPDPRDHLLMRLTSARQRLGFGAKGSARLLNRCLKHDAKRHRVESWRVLARELGLRGADASEPRLEASRYRSSRVEALLDGGKQPLVVLHAGAAVRVRRWPEEYFAEIVHRLRAEVGFRLLIIPDTDGFGSKLSALADAVLEGPAIGELVDVLSRADLVLCNDSGPMHVAAACGRSTVPFWGPGNPDWFRPWGSAHRVIIRDICPYRPCRDYCRFPEPYCLTRLRPDVVWPEVSEHARLILTQR